MPGARRARSPRKQDWAGGITLIPRENFLFAVIPGCSEGPDARGLYALGRIG
jgi:hypothetical protein